MPEAWTILSRCLLACGIGLFLWSLFWDRSRGRLRCRKCWYDMKGVTAHKSAPPWTCPECGRSTSNVRQLHRTRRRWRFLAPALTLLIAAYSASQVPLARKEGWRAAVPTWIIVTVWPLDIDAWLWNTAGRGTIEFELNKRLSWTTTGPLERMFVWRMERHARAQNTPAKQSDPPNPDRVISLIELEPIRAAMCAGDYLPSSPLLMYGVSASRGRFYHSNSDTFDPKADLARSLVTVLQSQTDIDRWADYGGVDAAARCVGSSLLIIAPSSITQQAISIFERLSAAAQINGEVGPIESRALVETPTGEARIHDLRPFVRQVASDVGHSKWPSEATPAHLSAIVGNIEHAILRTIDPDDWVENGGEIGSMHWLDPVAMLVIRHKPEVHKRIQLYINDLLQRYRDQGPEVLWADPAGSESDETRAAPSR